MKQQRVSLEKKPRKEESRERAEAVKSAQPKAVGGILRMKMGSNDAEERMKMMKFKVERRLGKDNELLE